MGVAMRNTGDATSMLQTAEGAFSEMTDILQRMKDLATQGANGTNSATDLTSLQGEYDELSKELRNIMDNTSYAGDKLFGANDGAALAPGKFGVTGGVNFQIGATTAEKMTFDASTSVQAVNAGINAASAAYMTPGTPGTELTASANATIDKVATALNAIGTVRAKFGATINRLNHTNNNLANMKDNTEMAKGRIMDADFAVESANMSKNSMLMQSGISMLKQAGQMPGMVMSLLG